MADATIPLQDLLVEELRDLYNAETQMIRALPRLTKAASCAELKRAFRTHLLETRRHAHRLEQIGRALDVKLSGKKCHGMEGLLGEGRELLKHRLDAHARDAGLIGAAQKVEHYEIAAYGTARTHAETLGHGKIADLLQRTLDEEGATDKKLTEIAERVVNPDAVHA
jgi:ferritin-like metal-binding protein YciE